MAPAPVVMFALLVSLAFPLKTKNPSLEALATTLITPILIFLCLKNMASSVDAYFLMNSLRVIGLLLIITSTVLLFSNGSSEKRMAKYGLFYSGNLIFLLSMNTTSTWTMGLIYMLMLALIYDARLSIFSIFNLAMLPPSPAFIIKLSFLHELAGKFHPIYQIVIILSSLAIMFHAAIDIYKIGSRRPLLLKIVSITAIIVVLMYLEELKTVLNKVIGVFVG